MDIAASFSQALRTFGFNQLLENTLLVKLIEFFILSKCLRCISFYRLNCRICDVSRSVPENY